MKQDDSVETPFDDITALTAKITAEYLRGNRLPATGISEVISLVHDALRQLGRPAVPEKEPQRPAVPIRKSVTAEYIVCLEDGRKLKMLKRHLRSTYGMTPDEYRAKWNLPADYPMVAPRPMPRNAASSPRRLVSAGAGPNPSPSLKQLRPGGVAAG